MTAAGARHSPAAERNKEPILARLRLLLPASGCALEIASGTGQHAAWFAAGLPGWSWQPTDGDASARASIDAHCAHAGLANVRPARRLDVLAAQWPAEGAPFAQPFDAIYCANMIHIAPWATCAALMQGAARLLAPDGVLIMYGPYLQDDVATAAGNMAFDQSLHASNPAWGLRPLAGVVQEAAQAGLALTARHAMPANNLLLAFKRAAIPS